MSRHLDRAIIASVLGTLLIWLCLFLLAIQVSTPVALEIFHSRPVLETFRAEVVRIVDGDTMEMAGHPENFRFASVDAPEKKQRFGKEATDSIQYLVGQTVTVYQVDTYRYKRPVAFFVLDNGTDVNAQLVRDGLAWHSVKYSNDKDLQAMEDDARRRRVGLWSNPKSVPPWKWREKKRTGGSQ